MCFCCADYTYTYKQVIGFCTRFLYVLLWENIPNYWKAALKAFDWQLSLLLASDLCMEYEVLLTRIKPPHTLQNMKKIEILNLLEVILHVLTLNA